MPLKLHMNSKSLLSNIDENIIIQGKICMPNKQLHVSHLLVRKNKQHVTVVFIDLSKAFDTISYKIQLHNI